MAIVGFDGGGGDHSEGGGPALEGSNGKERGSPLEPPEGISPANTLILAQ